MTRTVDHLDGLALMGAATVGPLRIGVPALLESRAPGESSIGPTLESVPSAPGTRRLAILEGPDRFEFVYPVGAPEITGSPGGISAADESVVVVHAPFDGPTADGFRSHPPELVVLGNARALWAEGRPFVDAIRDLRAHFGAGPLLWCPRVALPHRIPFLVYLGVDLLDTTEGRLVAAQGMFLDPTLGVLGGEAARAERVCDCPGCSEGGPRAADLHAVETGRRALRHARAAAREGRLRELVEARLPAEPALAEMLRYADRDLSGPFEERMPVALDASRTYVVAEAHRRPEMVRFRARLRERYRPPPSKSVLLLVPCSKRKPYRTSRSHRRFQSALDGLAGLERVHLVSVSSPIGLVPRELEDVPPARQYDIPVTGDWSEEERVAVTDALDHLLRTGAYRSVVVHLAPEEYRFLRDRFPTALPVRWTLKDDRTTSPEGLRDLRGAVTEALAGTGGVPGGPLAVVREELREVAAFQFGRPAADRLFAEPIRLAGRPWFQRLTDGTRDLASLREERGLFYLTVAGARRLGPDAALAVEVHPGVPLTGDLFVPGVRSASREIRAGDSVLLRKDGALAGVGEAVLPGPLLMELRRGLAVRVRHRVHASTDTALTGPASSGERGPVV